MRVYLRWLQDHIDWRIVWLGAIGMYLVVWLLAILRNVLILHPQV